MAFGESVEAAWADADLCRMRQYLSWALARSPRAA